MTDVAIQPVLFGMEQAAKTSDDYYTPAWVFERMGIEFDLDVCSPPGGLPWIPAKRYFTMADDGLAQPWVGRVWCNPPYSGVERWADRMITHGNGVALLPYSRGWWRVRVWASADGIAEIDTATRVTFVRDGKPADIFFPVFFAAFGEECVEAISRLGRVRR
jgi:hypothetical protein